MEQFEHQNCSVLYKLIKIPFILVEILCVCVFGSLNIFSVIDSSFIKYLSNVKRLFELTQDSTI